MNKLNKRTNKLALTTARLRTTLFLLNTAHVRQMYRKRKQIACKAGGFSDGNASKTAITNDQPPFWTREHWRNWGEEKRKKKGEGEGKREGEWGRRTACPETCFRRGHLQSAICQRTVKSRLSHGLSSLNSKQTYVEHERSVHMVDKRETPKKPVKRGRKPKEESINDFCRLCNCALKRNFDDFEKIEYISTENLFKESNRKDCSSRPLAQLCEELIVTPVVKSDRLSDPVCKPCGRKVRNAHAVKQQVLSINEANNKAENASDSERFKRQVSTSVNSPDRSPRFRKGSW